MGFFHLRWRCVRSRTHCARELSQVHVIAASDVEPRHRTGARATDPRENQLRISRAAPIKCGRLRVSPNEYAMGQAFIVAGAQDKNVPLCTLEGDFPANCTVVLGRAGHEVRAALQEKMGRDEIVAAPRGCVGPRRKLGPPVREQRDLLLHDARCVAEDVVRVAQVVRPSVDELGAALPL